MFQDAFTLFNNKYLPPKMKQHFSVSTNKKEIIFVVFPSGKLDPMKIFQEI